MKRRDAINSINLHKADLVKFGVKSLALCGSVARDEATPESDVDVLVEFTCPVGLFDFFRVQHYLEDILGVKKVDLLMLTALKPAFREAMLSEAINVA
jgi:hypothetical protein